MALASGTKLGPYEIESPIGAGGMGEVYRARDTRLQREVALKILPDSFAKEDDRLHRFEQEARAVATLNHPNILAVFDTGQHNGLPFLVSELLEGETLRAILDQGPLPQRKSIDYGVQVAQGLASAHERGIVHRDVKPENIFINRDGRVKILDFGLAKVAAKASAIRGDSSGATLTSSHTAAGMVMGTTGYMSPEQVRGEPADPRSDIFAFGAVLYEMLSGQRAFSRETPVETMTAILREDPPELTVDRHATSPALDRIVHRCLEKDTEQRFQSARDLSFALSALSGSDTSGVARVMTAPRRTQWVLWAVSGLAVLLASALLWSLFTRPARESKMQFAIAVSGEVSHMVLSPDGSMLAFVSPDPKLSIPVIYVQRVGSADARILQGTEGAAYPFWSPDGVYLAFFGQGKLQKVAIAGGPPQALANSWAARGGTWGKSNVIVYAPDTGGPLWRINADGSGAAQITDKIFTADDQSHRWPMFLPDGKHFLFWAGNFAGIQNDRLSGIVMSSIDQQSRKFVTEAHSNFAVVSKHLIYADDEQHLVAVPFDLSSGTISGGNAVLANRVGFQASTYWASFSAANNGTVIYNNSTGLALSVLTWMDRAGKVLGHIGEPAVQYNPTLSPDQNRVALDVSDPKANNVDLWLESTQGAGNSRFTFDPAEEVVGVWSHDGSTVAYRSAGGSKGSASLLSKATNGLQPERAVTKFTNASDIIPNSWSRDDQLILCTVQTSVGYDLQVVPSKGGSPGKLQLGGGNQQNGMISPDGRWVAYESDESGSWEIYVSTFPGAAGKWQVSRGGGTEPRWRGDGKEIFYIGPNGTMMAVPVNAGESFATGSPVSLFQFNARPPISSTDVFSYDVSKDGKRFLVNRYVKPDSIAPLTIILHADSPPTE